MYVAYKLFFPDTSNIYKGIFENTEQEWIKLNGYNSMWQ